MKKLGGQNFTGQKVTLSPLLSVKPDMRWTISQNPNNRLMALVAAGGEYIEDN